MSLISIGKMFNRDHSTVIHGLRTFDNVKLYEDFMDYTRKEFELFKINTFRRDLYTLNRTPIQYTRAI
jgi:chromosomal replication initiation ATPase DnaA